MSYYIWLEIDTGNGTTAEVGPDLNYTSNVSLMWRKALEGTGFDGLAAMDGRRASECEPALRAAVAAMDADFDAYEAMNPDNKCDNATGARDVLWRVANWYERHPNTTVRIHR